MLCAVILSTNYKDSFFHVCVFHFSFLIVNSHRKEFLHIIDVRNFA